MSWLESFARIFGGKRRGLVRLRDALSLAQAGVAVAAVAAARSASPWAVALTVLLAAWAMLRPLPDEASKLSRAADRLAQARAMVVRCGRAWVLGRVWRAGAHAPPRARAGGDREL